jgi:biotin-(acetyl-CoA carboxylase) ligase
MACKIAADAKFDNRLCLQDKSLGGVLIETQIGLVGIVGQNVVLSNTVEAVVINKRF